MTKQKYPEPTVGLFIFNSKGEILLIKTHKWWGKYAVPGGKIELGETMEQTARREALEETGLKVFNLKFIHNEEMIFDKLFFKKKHYIFIDFSCQTKSSKVKLNDEAEDYVWIAPEEAIKLRNIEPYARKTINIYLENLKRS